MKIWIRKTVLTFAFSAVSAGAAYAQQPVEENTEAPEVCVTTSDAGQVAQYTPTLARDLNLLKQLPLTGQPVYEAVTSPNNGITSCLFPVPEGQGSRSTYKSKKARIARGDPSSTPFHEYFHASQDMAGGFRIATVLTMKDAAVAYLLQEAAAVAYEMATQQEAENHNVPLFFPQPIMTEATEIIPGVGTHTVTRTITLNSASSKPENKTVFKAAYNAAWQLNASTDPQTRERRSLEAGGQAIVRYLMEGKDTDWKEAYVEQTIENVNLNMRAFVNDGREKKLGYETTRRSVYMKENGTLHQFNFIPEEYLGYDAPKAIDKCFKGMGFTIERVHTSLLKFPTFG